MVDLRFAIGDLRFEEQSARRARPRHGISIANRKSKIANLAPRGFTLTEILIVIALIVLILALAVPAFNFITGSRSVDAGQNLVSAMLGRARADAMLNNRISGVAFFRDPLTQRDAMALVVQSSQRGSATGEPAGLEEYKGWRQTDEAGKAINYNVGDVVIDLVDSNSVDPTITPRKKITKLFVCGQQHTASAANEPPATPYWVLQNQGDMDTLEGVEYQVLPAGVGVQTINDPNPTGLAAPPAHDRYLHNGMILFDGTGAVLHKQYTIDVPSDITQPANQRDQTHLFYLMGFDQRGAGLNNQPVGTNANFPLFSQLGVVLYDEQEFKNAGGNDDDPVNNNANLSQQETAEESWIDNNSLSLMLDRYNGTLVRGE